MSLVPSGTGFAAETKRDGHVRSEAQHILHIPGGKERAPVQGRRRWIVQERGNCAALKRGQSGKRCLPELAQGDIFIRLELLEPRAHAELMHAARYRETVLEGEQ